MTDNMDNNEKNAKSIQTPATDHEFFSVSRWADQKLPRLNGMFVTGTDTEVGKTMIAGAICRSLYKSGVNVEPFKPAASGCRHSRGELISSDAEFLAACADSSRPLSEITPVRLATALAPNVAAAHENRAIDVHAIFDAYRRLEGNADAVVVEGVGGLLCPISDDLWVIHLAKMMALPLVIVARPGLGTINHTLLTIHAARTAGLTVAGVIINRYQIEPWQQERIANDINSPTHGDNDRAMFTNPQQIADRGNVPVLALVPDDTDSDVEQARLGDDIQCAIDRIPLKKIAGLRR